MASQSKHERLNPYGFTLIELLVVIAIVGILAAMILPALSRTKSKAKSVKCRSNLRQTGLALQLYLDDHERFPPFTSLYFRMDFYANYGSSPSLQNKILSAPFGKQTLVEAFDHIAFCPRGKSKSGYIDKSKGNGIGWKSPRPMYIYNSTGPTKTLFFGFVQGYNATPHLGLTFRKEEEIVAPSEMIAMSCGEIKWHPWDHNALAPSDATGFPSRTSWHLGKINQVAPDGHVDSEPIRNYMTPGSLLRNRWSYDNSPHADDWKWIDNRIAKEIQKNLDSMNAD